MLIIKLALLKGVIIYFTMMSGADMGKYCDIYLKCHLLTSGLSGNPLNALDI